MRFHKAGTERSPAFLSCALSLAKHCSIGLRSGHRNELTRNRSGYRGKPACASKGVWGRPSNRLAGPQPTKAAAAFLARLRRYRRS
jgi:hypothetical protein